MSALKRRAFSCLIAAAIVSQVGAVDAQETDLAKALRAGGKPLTGAEIRTLYLGNTHYWRSADLGEGVALSAEDGRAASKGRTISGQPINVRGTFRIEGDAACWAWMTNPPRRSCLVVMREGPVYQHYNRDTGAKGTTVLEFKPGNPENL